jgi:predicted transposase/invertase (TIGR01784 family)
VFGKFLDPKNDVAFKKIFGTEKNKDILIHFLNDMIEFGEEVHIQDVTFLKTVQDPEIRAKKTSIVDILCKDERGNRYIVEMQVAKEKGFEKRAQYYASKAYASQMNKNEEFHTLKAVIFVAIADFIMFPKKKSYKSDHVILDIKSHENDLKDFSFTFLELPKFNKSIDELSNTTEMWFYFFKHAEETSEEDLQKLAEYEHIITKAYEELNRFSWNEAELLTYDQEEKYEATYRASLEQKFDEGERIGIEKGIEKGKAEGEKIGIEKGIEKGKAEGEKIGIEKGIEKGKAEGEKIGIEKGIEKGKAEGERIGIEKGKAEGETAALLKIAKNLLNEGLKVQDIQKVTGLSEKEIASLHSP